MKTPDELVDYVARTESGGDYSAFSPNDNGHGISFGIIQFNQQVGSLPKLLQLMYKADPAVFVIAFGSGHDLEARGLWDQIRNWDMSGAVWPSRFRHLGAIPPFQAVQRALARQEYLEPAWALAQRFGLKSERAAAMCFDVAVQYGIGGLEGKLDHAQQVLVAIGPSMEAKGEGRMLQILADMTDRHSYDKQRRHRILHDPALSDEPWSMEQLAPPPPRTLRRGDEDPSCHKDGPVSNLQRDLNRVIRAGLNECGVFGPVTEEAVRRFQADVGLVVDGIVGPITAKKLAERVAEIEGKGGERG